MPSAYRTLCAKVYRQRALVRGVRVLDVFWAVCNRVLWKREPWFLGHRASHDVGGTKQARPNNGRLLKRVVQLLSLLSLAPQQFRFPSPHSLKYITMSSAVFTSIPATSPHSTPSKKVRRVTGAIPRVERVF